MPHSPAPAPATSQRHRTTPQSAGLPDPRPITEYNVSYSEPGGHSRITIELDQPCIIRSPDWRFIDCADGSTIAADSVEIEDNTKIHFDFAGLLPKSVAFVAVPYQDMQVQNFRGGFVRPGGQWFRSPE